MEEKHIFEGKTSTEAIEKGLKELKLRREEVEINILKEQFNPRIRPCKCKDGFSLDSNYIKTSQ